MCQF
ncbi:hypothetical protein PENSTE_c022G00124 [Penicillium steckii]|jgi:hypothetical protein